ncbi:hypothetical protein HPG69_013145 [Diceros bicornis minor]|uniref:Uncharacterized protein n=1 Tax=Diceros bicornis minor TaxID=77932 RepID=A0A7J7F444_DICBM|nr:hypothetical protein HPG69_013145 [Diceros bicornis minor]
MVMILIMTRSQSRNSVP